MRRWNGKDVLSEGTMSFSFVSTSTRESRIMKELALAAFLVNSSPIEVVENNLVMDNEMEEICSTSLVRIEAYSKNDILITSVAMMIPYSKDAKKEIEKKYGKISSFVALVVSKQGNPYFVEEMPSKILVETNGHKFDYDFLAKESADYMDNSIEIDVYVYIDKGDVSELIDRISGKSNITFRFGDLKYEISMNEGETLAFNSCLEKVR